MSKINSDLTIFEACKIIDQEIKTDFGGGSPIEKTFIMAYLVQNQNLKNFVEIGVYNGKSLFPTAYSIYKNKGKSYGIDPYDLNYAKEVGVENNLKNQIDTFLENLNFENLYKNVILYKNNCGFGESIKLIRKPSEKTIDYFKKNKIDLDIIHIDGNHDTKYVEKDYKLYYEILKTGGFLVFDDINWDSVNVIYQQAKKQCIEIFNCNTFGVLQKKPKTTLTIIEAEKLNKKLTEIYNKTADTLSKPIKTPNISVGILTYNHVDYIEKCITSVVTQTGNFNLNIFICDDCSTDGTSEKIQKIIDNIPIKENIKINYIKNKKNIGIIPNLKQLIYLLKNSDYFTFCEGDDYYLSSTRIEQHLQYHKKNPETILSFNKLLMYFQNEDKYEVFEPDLKGRILNTENLITENFIGNFSACFYSSRIFPYIKDDLFDMYTVDWMFNIFSSQYGDIGRLNEPLNVYRKHDNGVWSGINKNTKIQKLVEYIDQYNKYLNFCYDKYFTNYRNKCIAELDNQIEQLDIAIIDDVFPHPLSGFRYQEFTSILESFKKSTAFTNGRSLVCLGNKNIEELLIEYKRKNPNLSSKIQEIYSINNFNYKLIYCTFLNNAYYDVIPLAEQNKIPFIFTLYPGGGFGINNRDSDAKLKRVIKSPCFKKVIVTQTITYNYLIRRKLCPKEKIEFIYGVVTPIEKLESKIKNKKHYKFKKETLDICFVAHKYTKYGEDKGYDIFIEVAKKLSKKYNNINFHVVGPFDKNVLDTKGIRNINFYGIKDQNYFDNFYKNKDIILSPNINSKIFKGSFDGFPTGSVTDAAIRKVAMFCTDPLKLNNKFIDGKDIVIIKHDSDDITKKTEYYINNPIKLKKICENGYDKVKNIYSYNNQIKPRLKILNKAINQPFTYKKIDFIKLKIIKKILFFLNNFKKTIKKIILKIINLK